MTTWELFQQAARLGEPERVPVGLIVDSPWLPGYAGIDTRDYFLFPEKWLEINKGLLERFPDAVWIPGFWVEYGMAAEPSAFGVKLRFHPNSPPSIEPVVTDLVSWAEAKPADPQEDGLMPLVLRMYQVMDERLRADGLGIRDGLRAGAYDYCVVAGGYDALDDGRHTQSKRDVQAPGHVDHVHHRLAARPAGHAASARRYHAARRRGGYGVQTAL